MTADEEDAARQAEVALEAFRDATWDALLTYRETGELVPVPGEGGGVGLLTVDEAQRSALKDGKEVDLTMKEFDLILFLMKNPGKVFSRENLLDLVWGYDYLGDSRTVDVHIRRLREKLEQEPANPEYILTKWGVGYYFAE